MTNYWEVTLFAITGLNYRVKLLQSEQELG